MATHPETTGSRAPADAGVVYEHPLNERYRTFMRLEFLLEQTAGHADGHSTWDSRAAVNSLLDILSLLGRGDVRMEILRELERQHQTLERMSRHSGVDAGRLERVLEELYGLRRALGAQKGPITGTLRENELLSSLRQRASIPGGACTFDLPGFAHWLSRPPEQRRADLHAWIGELDLIRHGARLILLLARQSAEPQSQTAPSGLYQHSFESNRKAQLLRVSMPGDSDCYPEVSAGPQRFTVRFMQPDGNGGRPRQVQGDVEFALALCSL